MAVEWERVWVQHQPCGHTAPMDAPIFERPKWEIAKKGQKREKKSDWKKRVDSARAAHEQFISEKWIIPRKKLQCPACSNSVSFQLKKSGLLLPVLDEDGGAFKRGLALSIQRSLYKEIPAHLAEWRRAIQRSSNPRLPALLLQAIAQLRTMEAITDPGWWTEQAGRPLGKVLQRLPIYDEQSPFVHRSSQKPVQVVLVGSLASATTGSTASSSTEARAA